LLEASEEEANEAVAGERLLFDLRKARKAGMEKETVAFSFMPLISADPISREG